jgi:hypothetical protein
LWRRWFRRGGRHIWTPDVRLRGVRHHNDSDWGRHGLQADTGRRIRRGVIGKNGRLRICSVQVNHHLPGRHGTNANQHRGCTGHPCDATQPA